MRNIALVLVAASFALGCEERVPSTPVPEVISVTPTPVAAQPPVAVAQVPAAAVEGRLGPAAVTVGNLPATGVLQVIDASGRGGALRLSEVDRLQIVATYQASPGRHHQVLNVTAPSGHSFVSLQSEVQVGEDGKITSTTPFQVRGTVIERYNEGGVWRFSLVVDELAVASATCNLMP